MGLGRGDLDTIKAVKNAFGGTVNDVILTAVTGGFRELLASRGIDMRPLQIQSMIPVSMRTPGESTGGNQVSAMFAQLPIGVDDPVERLHAMTRQMQRVKKSGTPLTVDSIIGLADFVPPMLFATAGRVAANVNLRAFDTVTTNVPGPQIPLYLLGKQLQTLIPFVPLGPGSASRRRSCRTTEPSTSGSPPTTTACATCRCSSTGCTRHSTDCARPC